MEIQKAFKLIVKGKPINFKDRVGERHVNNQGLGFEIIEYFNALNSTVKFDDGLVLYNTNYSRIKSKSVANPYHKSVYEVGYVGIGRYFTTIHSDIYRRWVNILRRCYSEKEQIKNKSYRGVTVCEEWKCFQNFAKWYEENFNPKSMQDWHIDKDILIKGSKSYSPEICCLVPQEINNLLILKDSKICVGVVKVKDKFRSTININGNQKHLGYFYTVEEAFQAYKIAKERHIKEVAEEWKDRISIRVYQALINYKVEITD